MMFRARYDKERRFVFVHIGPFVFSAAHRDTIVRIAAERRARDAVAIRTHELYHRVIQPTPGEPAPSPHGRNSSISIPTPPAGWAR